jgi:hypothetical protein
MEDHGPNNKQGMMVYTGDPGYVGGHVGRRILGWDWLLAKAQDKPEK